MPKTKHHRQARTLHPRKPIQPFSLILQPAELEVLRKLATTEGTSIVPSFGGQSTRLLWTSTLSSAGSWLSPRPIASLINLSLATH